MKIGIPKETDHYEHRVALNPAITASLLKGGKYEILVENNAGLNAGFPNEQYEQAGAQIVDAPTLYKEAQLFLKVNSPNISELEQMPASSTLISFLYAYTQPDLVQRLLDKKITSLAMDAVPRITRAQSMDALSSQANLAGYKAVLLGANALGKIFPLMMTAAGTIPPAKVLIFGAGVAGLQAIATAKRLGAQVEVSDVRPETKEQVESLGGRFLSVESNEEVQTEGGYAKEVSADFLQKQKELIEKRLKEVDLVITTALVMGKKAPVLLSEDMVKSMKTGAVIVDMAVGSGGNCALSEINQTVQKYGVTIIGESNLPSLVAHNASALYAKNISELLLHLQPEKPLDLQDEILKETLITHEGVLVNERTKNILKL